MSMYALLRSKDERPTEEEIEEALGGNLCRCTGYRPILAGFKTFARDAPDAAYSNETIGNGGGGGGGGGESKKEGGGGGAPICPSTGQPCTAGCGNTPAVGPSIHTQHVFALNLRLDRGKCVLFIGGER